MSTFSDLLVLNAEIAALVRAGVPLELGLRRLSESVSGRLGAHAERLAVRLESGQSLVAALREDETSVTPLYAAVIEAAIEADRLPEALDGLVRFGRMLQETRRQVTLALMYPLVVAVVAYGLLVIFATVVAPAMFAAWDPLSAVRAWALPLIEQVRDTALWWVPGVPLLIWLLLTVFSSMGRNWSDTEFVLAEPGGGGMSAGFWIPRVPELYRDLDRAHATHVLGLLLTHGVPLPKSLELVSRMTGSAQLSAAFARLAEAVGQGRSLSAEVHFENRLPSLIAQLLRAGALDRDLPEALSKASEIYHRRAVRRAAWLRSTLAPVFAVVVGGGVTLLFALAFALPLRWMFQELLQFV